MIKSRIAVAAALCAAAGAANAGFTLTPAITTDYDFRGISQTNPDQKGTDPAFQLGANYTAENGLYGNLWGSNVDFGPGKPSMEIDYNVGFAGGDAKDAQAAGLHMRPRGGVPATGPAAGEPALTIVAVSRSGSAPNRVNELIIY